MNTSSSAGHVLALAGGVGGAKLVRGLTRRLPVDELTVVVNTGDDFEHLGLTVCPDLDSVMYAVAGLNDTERGWGLVEETWQFMRALGRLGGETWFSLGDQDLATHVVRTEALRQGESLSAVTRSLFAALGIEHSVAPMADEPVRTRVHTDEGVLDFQRYFVERQCAPRVEGFEFAGAGSAKPSAALSAALARPDLRAIVICPSNPFISIDPMLAIPGVRQAIEQASAPVVAVSPIVGGAAIKGPAAKMLDELGHDVSVTGIARHYGALLDGLVLDETDAALASDLAPLPTVAIPTLMRDDADRERVTDATLALADSLR